MSIFLLMVRCSWLTEMRKYFITFLTIYVYEIVKKKTIKENINMCPKIFEKTNIKYFLLQRGSKPKKDNYAKTKRGVVTPTKSANMRCRTTLEQSSKTTQHDKRVQPWLVSSSTT
jgi:uncharacterized protein (UPF0303 family)